MIVKDFLFLQLTLKSQFHLHITWQHVTATFPRFFPKKCNFFKKSLDSSKPKIFPRRLLKFPVYGQIPQKWEICIEANHMISGMMEKAMQLEET